MFNRTIAVGIVLLGIASTALGNAAEAKRCADLGVNSANMGTMRGYNTLKWAFKCKNDLGAYFPRESFKAAELGTFWDFANRSQATNKGTFFPESGDPHYDSVRQWVHFPVFVNSEETDYWKGPWDSEIQKRIDAEDCTLQPPSEYTTVFFCQVGCFAPETNLLVFDEAQNNFAWSPISESHMKRQFVAAVTSKSTFDSIHFTAAPIKYWLTDLFEAPQRVFRIETFSEKAIRVSPTHPLIDAKGFVVQAKDLKIGDALLDYQGRPDPIRSIEKQEYFGKVYNLDLKESKDYLKVIAANGLLSGTHWYQIRSTERASRVIRTAAYGALLRETVQSRQKQEGK